MNETPVPEPSQTSLIERACTVGTNDVSELSSLAEVARSITPARILAGRTGPAYRTSTLLDLREDHATAVDAVRAEFEPHRDWGNDFVERWQIVLGQSAASSKQEYLLRPDLGRRLSAETRAAVVAKCPARADLQIAIGDGLSAAAVMTQVPHLVPRLIALAEVTGLTCGRLIYVRYARVGLLNDLGDLLDAAVVVLLVGERPGLATAESLSAYLAHRPRAGDTDARRNLISNIHARGVPPDQAAARILALARKMLALRASGFEVKEDASPQGSSHRPPKRIVLPACESGPTPELLT